MYFLKNQEYLSNGTSKIIDYYYDFVNVTMIKNATI